MYVVNKYNTIITVFIQTGIYLRYACPNLYDILRCPTGTVIPALHCPGKVINIAFSVSPYPTRIPLNVNHTFAVTATALFFNAGIIARDEFDASSSYARILNTRPCVGSKSCT